MSPAIPDLHKPTESDYTIAEKLVLLLINEQDGSLVALSSNWRLWCGFIGAILLDLSFLNRIDTDLDSISVTDSTPTGDDLLDPTLKQIAESETPHSARYWIEYLAQGADSFIDDVVERLLDREVLVMDSAGFWSIGATDSSDPPAQVTHEVRDRIRREVLEDEIPDPYDVTLISLLRAFNGFRAMLSVDEYEQAEDRIELLAGLDLFGKAILDTVTTSYEPPTSTLQRYKALPRVRLVDFFKSKAIRQKDIPKFFAEMSQKYGPAFEVALPGRKYVVLVGAETNQWVGRRGRLYLRTRDYLEDFQTAWGTARSIASTDGADHYRMRKIYRASCSRNYVEERLDTVVELARKDFRSWSSGEILPGETTCQRFTGRQVAQLSVGVSPSIDLLDALLVYEFRALRIHVMKVMPKFMLRTPSMKKALKGVIELYKQIHLSHTPGQREGELPDLVDDLLALHQSDPQFMPKTDLEFAFIAPLIAGHYMGSMLSFAIYELLTHPEIAETMRKEADNLFANRSPTAADFTLEAIDLTHRFIMEVLRLHPVIPVHSRTAMNSFTVGEYLIPERTSVLVAFPSSHHLPELFVEPEKFDPDRFEEPRNEHRTPGAFQPFGLGTHACLGSRFAEFSMAANVLLILHHFELEMVPKNYELKLDPIPKYCPDKNFKFRVKNVRHPV